MAIDFLTCREQGPGDVGCPGAVGSQVVCTVKGGPRGDKPGTNVRHDAPPRCLAAASLQ